MGQVVLRMLFGGYCWPHMGVDENRGYLIGGSFLYRESYYLEVHFRGPYFRNPPYIYIYMCIDIYTHAYGRQEG